MECKSGGRDAQSEPIAREINCRNARALLFYARERGIAWDDLTQGLPVDAEYLLDTHNWISDEIMQALYRRLRQLSGDPEIAFAAGASAGRLRSTGWLDPLLRVVSSLEMVLRQAPRYNRLFNRTSEVEVRMEGPGHACFRSIPRQGYRKTRDDCLWTQGILTALGEPFGLPPVHVQEITCAVPLPEVHTFRGKPLRVDSEGKVWWGEEGQEILVGQANAHGEGVILGVRFGAEACEYALTWQARPSFWRRLWRFLVQRPQALDDVMRDLEKSHRLLEEKFLELERLNASLEARVRARTRHLQGLLQSAQDLVAILDEDVLLQRIINTAVQVVADAQRGSLLVLDGDVLRFRAAHGYDLAKLQQVHLPVEASMVPLLQPGTVHRMPRIARLAANLPPEAVEVLERYGALSEIKVTLCAPIVIDGQVYGYVNLDNLERADAFSAEDEDVLRIFADFAAVALRNARAYRAQHTAVAHLRSVLHSLTNGVLLLDAQGRMTFANPVAQCLLGISPSPGQEMLPPSQLTPLLTLLQVHDRKEARQEIVLGQQTYVVVASRVCGLEGEHLGYVVTFNDVSRFKALEAAKQSMIDAVAHDLRSPLSLAYGYVQLALDEVHRGGPEVATFLEETAKALVDMNTLLQDMVDLSHLEQGLSLRPLNLSHLLRRLRNQVAARAQEKNLTLTLEVPAQSIWVQGEPRWLGRGVLNLLDNAIKYTPPGGRITLRAFAPSRKEVVIEVEDTGPGIAPEEQERIFDRFYRGEDAGHVAGSGLGLSIVRQVVEGHGGRLYVHSQPGQGSTFGIVLARAWPSSEEVEKETGNSVEKPDMPVRYVPNGQTATACPSRVDPPLQ